MRDPILLAIIAAAIAVRIPVAAFFPSALFTIPWEYEGVALNILKGNGFVTEYHGVPYFALVHPLYPLICAAVYWVVGHSSLLAMQVVQTAVVIPAAWLSYQFGCDLGGRRAGLLAAFGVTFHPALLVFSLRRHSLWFDAILFLATLVATYRLRAAPTTRRLVLYGLLFGVAMLSRSTSAVFMGIAFLWLAWQWRVPYQQAVGRAAISIGIALLVVAPWLVRNTVVFHRPVGFVSTGGQSLWLGNNPAATGGALAADGSPMEDIDPAFAASINARDEMGQHDLYRETALRYIASDPGMAVVHYFQKLRNFYLWSDQTGAWYPAWFRAPYQFFYVVLLGAALFGGYRLVRAGNGPAVVLCATFFFSVGLLQSVFYVEGRHRWGVESVLVILAACGVASLFATSPATDAPRQGGHRVTA